MAEHVFSPLNFDRLCIHQVTLMQCDFRQSVECLSRHGVTKIVPWIEKIEAIGAKEAKRILDDCGVQAVSMAPAGHLTGQSPAELDASLERNRQWLEIAATIGASSIVTLTGGLAEGEKGLDAARARAYAGLERLIPIARSAGVKIALEPLHPMVCGFRSVICTVREALDMIEQLDAPGILGVALDSYALWWDAQLAGDIKRAGSRIINFHVSDWLAQTQDVRLDRGMPGDGLIGNLAIRQILEEQGFQGLVEVEIFSAQNWWKRDADEVVATIIDRAKNHL